MFSRREGGGARARAERTAKGACRDDGNALALWRKKALVPPQSQRVAIVLHVCDVIIAWTVLLS